jgi:diguanylate cyclase (GGDEF)-like protein
MMNYAFLPDLSALAILIVILALVRRNHNEERANAWLLGLGITLIEAVAHSFYPQGQIPNRTLHVIVLDCYLLAGLVFLWAAGDQMLGRGTRLLYLVLNGFPLLLLMTTYGLNLRTANIYLPTIALGLVVGVASSVVLLRSWRFALFNLMGWVAIAALVANGRFRPAVYWSLACLYAIAAINFYRKLERRSAGKVAIVTGFAIWSLCFLLHPWIVNYASFVDIASHVWNMQKSLISIGMILVMLEEQVSNNEWLALHDELTGLPNRRLFASKLNLAIEHCDRRHTSLALVVLDLDGFKQINDSLGHVAGDQVLREVASLLRKSVRSTDTVARLGGDEFTIVATDMATENTVERFVESIRLAIERPFLVQGQAMSLTASLGSAIYPQDAKDSTKLLRVADQRMYFLKKRPVQPVQIAAGASAMPQA